MTERHPKESFIGHAGRLLFQPFGVGQAEDCNWQSARNVAQKGPCFKDLGAYKKWYSGNPGPQSADETSGTTWQKCRKQKTWLLKSHPESRLGNGVIHNLLSEAHSPEEPDQGTLWHPAPFALGELTDRSNAQSVSSAPYLALAVGGANNILRLLRLDQEEWRWKGDETVGLRLLDVSDYQPATWEGGIGSIRRMKSVVDSKRYDPTRWLIVQWDSETRVFQPEFGKLPIGPRLPGGEEPSRIAANELFSLSKRETGGSSHTDAAFNPNTRSKPAQLGLIDEKGYWSIWDVAGIRLKASGKARINLYRCGHIQDGVLKQLPYQAMGYSDWHTICWVGSSEDPLHELDDLNLEDDTTLPQPQSALPPLERSSTLLLGNSKQLRLLDLNTNIFLPDIAFVPGTGLARILDVQLCQDPRYFIVLTTSRLFVVGLFSTPGLRWDEPTKHWSILLSSPHYRDGFGSSLRLNVAPGANLKGYITTIATLYSTRNTWLDIFYVNIARHNPELINFCREAINLEVSQDPPRSSSLQAIQLYPVVVANQSSELPDEAVRLVLQQQVRFYQLVTLDSQFNVVSELCVSSTNPVNQIAAPKHRMKKATNHLRERKQIIRHLGSRFVVPDYLTFLEGSDSNRKRIERKNWHSTPPAPKRFLRLMYEQFSDVFRGSAHGQVTSEGAFGSNTFDAVHYAVQDAVTTCTLPATTLLQIIRQYDLPKDIRDVAGEWDVEVERLQHIDPSLLLLDFGSSSGTAPEQSGSSLGDIHTRLLKLDAGVLQDDENSTWITVSRQAVLQKMACDLYLSLCGLVYGIPDPTEETQQHEPISASQLDHSDDLLIPSSSAPQSLRSSSVESQTTMTGKSQDENEGEPAMTFLKAYTDSGKFIPRKRFELLGQWKIGADPNDYVFDLDKEKEITPGMQRRARKLARESRKRRRAESILQLSREPSLLPSTQPAPDVRFSQRTQPVTTFSSQVPLHSDPVTMSQPVPGPFAQRPKKRTKRKGGF